MALLGPVVRSESVVALEAPHIITLLAVRVVVRALQASVLDQQIVNVVHGLLVFKQPHSAVTPHAGDGFIKLSAGLAAWDHLVAELHLDLLWRLVVGNHIKVQGFISIALGTNDPFWLQVSICINIIYTLSR